MKRMLDIVLGGAAFLLLLPVMLGAALAVWLSLGRPILYRQTRPGLHGKPFALVKFRTMSTEQDPEGTLLPDSERIYPTGRFLRNWSLDELPGLVNVLRGEMSLVGPRPLLMQYLDRYTAEQQRRHDVRPGMTGWAQIKGRNAIGWDEKFAYDIWYVDHQNLLLDLRILLLTAVKLLRPAGIAAPGSATMPEFLGHQSHREE